MKLKWWSEKIVVFLNSELYQNPVMISDGNVIPCHSRSPECHLLFPCSFFATEKKHWNAMDIVHWKVTKDAHWRWELLFWAVYEQQLFAAIHHAPFTANLLIRQMQKRINRSVSYFQLQVNWFFKSIKEQNIQRHDKICSHHSAQTRMLFILYIVAIQFVKLVIWH